MTSYDARPDWAALQATAKSGENDLDGLKAALPIAYVLERAGIAIEEGGNGLKAVCPFHEDEAPSLDVYGERLERWGCFPCGAGGDVFDLIQRLKGYTTFPETKAKAELLVSELAADGWTGPTTGVTRTFNAEAARTMVDYSAVNDPIAVLDFLEAKAAGNPGLALITQEWLAGQFRVGASSGDIIMPYLDRDGQLVTYKRRNAHTKSLSAEGSNFDNVLYGEWRDLDPKRTVLLAEGETDVWAAAHALPEYAVLGIPTGAGAHPKQASRLAGRRVVVALDGDPAGRGGVVRWYAALTKEGCEVLIAPMPDGYDLAKLSPDQLREVVRRARPVPTAPKGIGSDASGYYRPGKEEHHPMSNWTFDPDRELVGKGGSAYEGVVLPAGERAVLSSVDLGSKARIVSWSSRHGGSWYGADRDAQLLLGTLQAAGPFLASGRMSMVAGLHEGHFIWPGGRIGPDYWMYVPPPADVHLEGRMTIHEDTWHPIQVPVLRSLHQARVMDPILAWLAVAPLRSMLREFPILAITGSSGTGKTTLTETVVKNFTGTSIANNLTSTTRHAIFSFAGASNAFPVWFDEYRPGARVDAIQTLNQVLRDAYTGQASSKGGMGENWAEVVSVAAIAPMIVSGEDAFSETSHTERMVLVSLPLDGKNPEALARVKDWGDSGFAHAYLTWLHEGLRDGTLPAVVNGEAGPEDLPGRQRLNLGVLEMGWALLNAFLRPHGYDLGEPDWSLVIEEGRAAAASNPIRDALLWAMDETDAAEFVAQSGERIGVRVENFVRYVQDRGGFILPGGPAAVRKYLQAHYGAEPDRMKMFGQEKSVMAFDADRLHNG